MAIDMRNVRSLTCRNPINGRLIESEWNVPLSRCRLVEIILGSIIKQLVNLVHDVIDGNRKGAVPRPNMD